jgi:hypothetical protein
MFKCLNVRPTTSPLVVVEAFTTLFNSYVKNLIEMGGYWVANLREKGGLFDTWLATSRKKRAILVRDWCEVGSTTCFKSLR